MIYKFRLEVWNDENSFMMSSQSEESGNFWWAFSEFMVYVMSYAIKNSLPRLEP